MSRHLTRQFDLVPMSCLGTPITVIGAGAIGSMTVLHLAKMGFEEISVIDFDKVDVVNMNSQFFRFKDIGKPKVTALRDLIADFTGLEIQTRIGKYLGKERFPGIVVSAVDSMAARRAIWEAHAGRSPSTLAVIDARTGAEQAMFFAMRPMNDHDCESYPKSLYTDSEALPEPCTARAIMYTVSMVAGLVAKTVKDVAAGKPYTRSATWNIKKSQFLGWVVELPKQEEASALQEDAPEVSSAELLAEPV